MSTVESQCLRVVTWNVHRFVGRDGREDPERIAEAARMMRPDVLCLQECVSHAAGNAALIPLELIREGCDLPWFHFRATMQELHTDYGLAIMSRFPIRAESFTWVSRPRREPRGFMTVELDVGGAFWRVVNLHWGLQRTERRAQTQALLRVLPENGERTIVTGDVNEWWERAACLALLRERFGGGHRVASFPAGWPVIGLDRIWWSHDLAGRAPEAIAAPTTAIASDHLPLVAEVCAGSNGPGD